MYNKVLSNCDRLIERAANPDAQLNERIDSKFCLNQVVELCFKGIIADSIDNFDGSANNIWIWFSAPPSATSFIPFDFPTTERYPDSWLRISAVIKFRC